MPSSQTHLEDLYQLFSSVDTSQEAELLIRDLFTPQEIDSLSERWQLIQELHAGTPQRTIAEKLGLSISKVTRGSHALQHGKGGFAHFLQKLHKIDN